MKVKPRQEKLVDKFIGLFETEMQVLQDYSMRNLGVSQPQAVTACGVINALIRQMRTYDYDTSKLQQQYREMRTQCNESWGGNNPRNLI